jgi:ubiquinone/menaquinone biosynthesis C-methylase UbiE
MPDESLREIVAFYTQTDETSRLGTGSSQLEFERTKELVRRFLPAAPARVLDMGGGSGPYAFWLADLGYEAHLADRTPRLVDLARARNAASPRLASITVGDARCIAFAAGSFDAALLLGPLYHLTSRADRLLALREAFRVLRPGGVVAGAAICRYAAALDGVALNPALDQHVVDIRHRAIADGQYRNDTGNPRYFVTAYFHRPSDLAEELEESGFRGVDVFGIEGPGWMLTDFADRWADHKLRDELLTVARLLEKEASVVGVSAHLLGVGRRP